MVCRQTKDPDRQKVTTALLNFCNSVLITTSAGNTAALACGRELRTRGGGTLPTDFAR